MVLSCDDEGVATQVEHRDWILRSKLGPMLGSTESMRELVGLQELIVLRSL